MNIFVFDIETIPDVEAGRQLLNLPANLSDEAVANAMFLRQRQQSNHEFLPHYLQQIVAISVVLRTSKSLKVWSLGDTNATEADILQRFFAGLEKFTPTLVTWNGSGFDLPVIHYRSLRQGVSSLRYWETGQSDNDFRWNNYLSRYHERHTDLMDVLAAYNNRAYAPLDKLATILGFPGKMGMSGAKVWEQYLAGNIIGIRNYCETDVLNTYLVYLRWQYIRGKMSQQQLQLEYQVVKEALLKEDKPHLSEFLEVWNNNATQ